MTTLALAHQAVTALPAPDLAVLAADGILDWGTTKVGELRTLMRLFSSVAAIGFVIYQGISSRGAMARIVVSGLAAGIFVWIVFNVTTLSDKVDKEVNGDAAPAAAVVHPGPAALAAGAGLPAAGRTRR